jgi:hypothetical protein
LVSGKAGSGVGAAVGGAAVPQAAANRAAPAKINQWREWIIRPSIKHLQIYG